VTKHDECNGRRAYEPNRYWNELVSTDATLRNVAYPEFSESFNRHLYRAMTTAVLEALALRGTDLRGESVLDIGSGTGVWVRLWERLGASRIVGLDLSAPAVDRLRHRYPVWAFHEADVSSEALPLEERFDVVSAMSVLLHITDDTRFARAISNISRLLEPDGTLIVMDPIVTRRWWGPPFDETSNSKARSLDEWEAALRGVGLEPEVIVPVTHLLANPVDTKRRIGFQTLSLYWSLLSALIGRRERLGDFLGRGLFQVDRLLLHVLASGPSTKLMFARRSDATSRER
jgi:SAM-dependent methyltransferase